MSTKKLKPKKTVDSPLMKKLPKSKPSESKNSKTSA